MLRKGVYVFVSVLLHIVLLNLNLPYGRPDALILKHLGSTPVSVSIIEVLSKDSKGKKRFVGKIKRIHSHVSTARVKKSTKEKMKIEVQKRTKRKVKKTAGDTKPSVPAPKRVAKPGNEIPKSDEGGRLALKDKGSRNEGASAGWGIVPPVVEKRVLPEYPYIAKMRGYQGKVVLRALVDTYGRVKKVVVVKSSGHPILDRCAIEALKQWRFVPAVKGNRRVEWWVEVPFVFRLEKN